VADGDQIPDVLADRYASAAMAAIWSPEGKVKAERRLWVAVLEAQRDLGIAAPDGAVEAYRSVIDQVHLDSIRQRERVTRHDVKARIRGGNSDLWRQFWADDQASPPRYPKHEESCRDALLEMVRNRLPEGVDAQPEGQYAADRRADIRVSFKDFNVPVEIKKNTHSDLWTAIEDQLIAKYATDPSTGGYGIYVVLWFGPNIEGYRRHPSDDDLPRTPHELARRLNESLSHEQRRQIGIVVLDVTKP